MYIFLFLIWIIFNGKFTWEIAILGLLLSGAIYIFVCKYFDFSPSKDMILCKKLFYILHYVAILGFEIVKANFAVIQMITSSKYELEPVLLRFRTDLKSKKSRVVLANSITLTPGTITVSLEENEYVVHCLDKEFARGINTSRFVTLLQEMERME